MSSLVIFHLVIFLVVVAVFYRLFINGARENARFKLYKVRDDLILLVAQKALREDDPVFLHFYTRINTLLRSAPNVGIDDIAEVMFTQKYRADLDKAMMDARKRIAKVHGDSLMSNPKVKEVALEYYQAVEYLMLTHSSWIRLFVFLTKFLTSQFAENIILALAGKTGKIAVSSQKFVNDIEHKFTLA